MVSVMTTYAVSGYFAIAVDERSPEGKPELPPIKYLRSAIRHTQDVGLKGGPCSCHRRDIS
jgi:hypothetical protein